MSKTNSMSLKEYFEKYMTPEAMQKKFDLQDMVFEQMDRLNKYLSENNCNIDDLIEAHKELNKNH